MAGRNLDKSLLSNYAEYYDAASFLPQQRDVEEVRRFAAIATAQGSSLDVLDVGCAEGELSLLLAQQGHRVTAADISPSFLAQARRRADSKGVVISTSLLDVEKAPKSTLLNSFDVIFFMDVIEHLRSPSLGLVTLRSMLRDSGNSCNSHTQSWFCSPSLSFFKVSKKAGKLFRSAESGRPASSGL